MIRYASIRSEIYDCAKFAVSSTILQYPGRRSVCDGSQESIIRRKHHELFAGLSKGGAVAAGGGGLRGPAGGDGRMRADRPEQAGGSVFLLKNRNNMIK